MTTDQKIRAMMERPCSTDGAKCDTCAFFRQGVSNHDQTAKTARGWPSMLGWCFAADDFAQTFWTAYGCYKKNNHPKP